MVGAGMKIQILRRFGNSEAALGLSLFAHPPPPSVHIITWSPQGFSIGSSQCTQLGKPVSLYKRVRLLWRHRQDLPQLLVLVNPPLSLAFNRVQLVVTQVVILLIVFSI
jgi:hypothetical protein